MSMPRESLLVRSFWPAPSLSDARDDLPKEGPCQVAFGRLEAEALAPPPDSPTGIARRRPIGGRRSRCSTPERLLVGSAPGERQLDLVEVFSPVLCAASSRDLLVPSAR